MAATPTIFWALEYNITRNRKGEKGNEKNAEYYFYFLFVLPIKQKFIIFTAFIFLLANFSCTLMQEFDCYNRDDTEECFDSIIVFCAIENSKGERECLSMSRGQCDLLGDEYDSSNDCKKDN